MAQQAAADSRKAGHGRPEPAPAAWAQTEGDAGRAALAAEAKSSTDAALMVVDLADRGRRTANPILLIAALELLRTANIADPGPASPYAKLALMKDAFVLAENNSDLRHIVEGYGAKSRGVIDKVEIRHGAAQAYIAPCQIYSAEIGAGRTTTVPLGEHPAGTGFFQYVFKPRGGGVAPDPVIDIRFGQAKVAPVIRVDHQFLKWRNPPTAKPNDHAPITAILSNVGPGSLSYSYCESGV